MKIVPNDIAIVRCLHEDARMSVAKIAKAVGLPESTVRNRLARLTESGVLECVAMTNPLKLGYQLWVMISIEVELSSLDEAARRLSEIPEIYFVAVITGGYEITASAVFRSNDELLSFITDTLATIPGVTHTITYNVLKVYKRRMNVLPPAESAPGDTATPHAAPSPK